MKIFKRLIDLAKRDAECFYQLALHAYRELGLDKSFDITTIFTDEEFNTMKKSIENNKIVKLIRNHEIKAY